LRIAVKGNREKIEEVSILTKNAEQNAHRNPTPRRIFAIYGPAKIS